ILGVLTHANGKPGMLLEMEQRRKAVRVAPNVQAVTSMPAHAPRQSPRAVLAEGAARVVFCTSYHDASRSEEQMEPRRRGRIIPHAPKVVLEPSVAECPT